jgi:single-strand DNA-binding protein
MSQDTTITIAGNLTADPELGYTQTGTAWCRFTIASTPRRYDTNSGGWVDGDTLFMRATCWREAAEHVADSLHKGHRVIATGRLRQSSWENPEGDKRTAIGLDVDDIGPSLRWSTARIARAARTNAAEPAPDDPWQTRPTVPAARTNTPPNDAATREPVRADAPPF